MKITRREMIGTVAAGAALQATQANAAKSKEKTRMVKKKLTQYPNEHFYNDDGTFDAEKGKEAFYEMMRFYNYPIPDRLKGEEFWTLDFGLGIYTEVGMAGIFWVNNLEHNYFGHEIYLLPGQMIPEHQHLATAAAGPKLEGWHVRHGWIYIYGEGEPTKGVDKRIPDSHKKCAVARTERILKPGEVAGLSKATEKHWMRAGPEGAIVTEYATYHDGDGLRFSHPKAKL